MQALNQIIWMYKSRYWHCKLRSTSQIRLNSPCRHKLMTKSCSHLTELRSVRVQFELLRTCYYLTAKITILICVFSFVNVFATIHIKYHCAHFGVWLTHISERKTLQASSSLVKRYVHCRASQSSPPRTAAAAATFKSFFALWQNPPVCRQYSG